MTTAIKLHIDDLHISQPFGGNSEITKVFIYEWSSLKNRIIFKNMSSTKLLKHELRIIEISLNFLFGTE